MEILSPIAAFALPATALLLLTLLWMRVRQRRGDRRGASSEVLDTIAGWPPQAARVLTVSERQAYELLRRAMPGFLVLAQVPLSRFLRVPTRNPYLEWVQRVGLLSADLLLCDAGSKVLAVIDIRAPDETARASQRHERMARVLQAAGIRVLTWYEGELPTLAEARTLLSPLIGIAAPGMKENVSRPPLGASSGGASGLDQILAPGDRAHAAPAVVDEPVPSAFLEDFEPATSRR